MIQAHFEYFENHTDHGTIHPHNANYLKSITQENM